MGMKERGEKKGVTGTGAARTPPTEDGFRGQSNIIVPGEKRGSSQPIQLVGSDYDHRQVTPPPQSSTRDVKQYSESEPLAEMGLARSIENAERVSKLMKEKNEREGHVLYVCPICREQFDKATPAASKKACASHIKKDHAMQVEAAKLEAEAKNKGKGKRGKKVEPVTYEPKRKLIPPVLNPADLVAPEHRRFYVGLEQSRQNDAALRASATSMRTGKAGNHFNVNQYMIQTENACIAGLGRLDDKQLLQVKKMAETKGKRMLLRAASKAVRDRAAAGMAFSK